MKDLCQICGQEVESPQVVTINNGGGLIEHKTVCSRCYYSVMILETNKKPENLILG